MISKILGSIGDLEEKIVNGSINVCFLHENTKISKKGWSEFVKPEELYDPLNESNNLGISLIGPKFPGDNMLTCIDIDGDKREINGQSVEQVSKDWLYQILLNEFKKNDIPVMTVRSSSGGYHIYIYTLVESSRYTSTYGLIYPKTLQNQNTSEEVKMFISGHQKQAALLLEEELPKTAIEIWCKKRYMVAPGSDISNDEGEYIGTVTLLDDGVQNIGDIGLYEGNLNDFVRQALLNNGFTQDDRQQYTIKKNINMNNMTHSSELTPFNIQNIGNFILEAYPKIEGQKHTATLALGGYFFNKKLSLKTIEDLGHYIADNAPEGLFKNKESFVTTLTHDIREQDETRMQTGLPTFEEILSPYYSKEYVGKKLHLTTNPTFHKFWPDGRYSKKYNEIIINHSQNYITKNVIQTKLSKDGDIIDNIIQNSRVGHSIEGIQKFDDISHPENTVEWEKPVKIYFKKYQTPIQESPVYENPDLLFKNYRRLEGAYTDNAKSIIESIYREYEALGCIETLSTSTRPGIYYDEKKNKLRKFIREKNNIKEIYPKKPTKEKLAYSLLLLKKINDVYPWNDGKFGFFIKNGLTMAYTDVLKYHFGKNHLSVILYGEAGTLKTTAAELVVNFNISSFDDFDNNIISGSELLSEYRLGKNLDKSSYPLVVNETEFLFSTAKIRETIKDSITGKFIRKPGGDNSRAYYSHRSCIYTTNNLPITTEDPSILRRFIPMEFDSTERGDTPELIEKMDFLNTNGVKNNEFKKMGIIGDFIFCLLNENINWFNYSIELLQDKIIEALEDHSGVDLTFLKKSANDFVYIDRTDRENHKLTLLLSVMRKPYRYHKNKFFKEGSEYNIVKSMLSKNYYSYAHIINDDYVLFDIGLKHEFNKLNEKDGISITLKGCYNLLDDLDLGLDSITYTTSVVQGRKKKVRGIKMSIEDFTKILTNKENPT